MFFRQHLWRLDDVYLLAGDEVVVSKAGAHTHGLDRFSSSLFGNPVPGLAFFVFALVNVEQRSAHRNSR